MFISDNDDFNETISNLINHNATNVNLYHEYFEVRFLRDVEDFYRSNATSLNDEDSLLTYLKRVRVTFPNTTTV